jgi:hypothetical protein
MTTAGDPYVSHSYSQHFAFLSKQLGRISDVEKNETIISVCQPRWRVNTNTSEVAALFGDIREQSLITG